jgi:hypothetical protein
MQLYSSNNMRLSRLKDVELCSCSLATAVVSRTQRPIVGVYSFYIRYQQRSREYVYEM